MLTVDKALSLYTDMIIRGDDIEINYFKDNLSDEDYKEFVELTEIINLTKSIKKTKRFDDIFSKMNELKQSIYHMPDAANYRTESDITDYAAEDELNYLFDEEFGKEFDDD